MKYINAATAAEIISDKLNIPLNDLCDIVAEIPSEDVQPVKHGRWINEGFLNIYCSNCSKTPDGWPTPMQTDYCPNCGGRMDGDSE
jgi:hypothetical protein